MNTETMKSNLRNYYNHEADYRSSGEKQAWKIDLRDKFCNLLASENKKTLLDELVDDFSEIPRFFSSFEEAGIKKALQDVFTIISFEQIDKSAIKTNIDFQSIIMRKKFIVGDSPGIRSDNLY